MDSVKRVPLQYSLIMFSLIVACFLISSISASDAIFYEPFDKTSDDLFRMQNIQKHAWVVSEKVDYKGVWKHEKSQGHDDYGLLVSEPAKKYAIVKVIDEIVPLKDQTVVLQFEARFQSGLECGGAYLKFLRPQVAEWSPKDFDNESPYSIMFGPDKCGSTNKVHFIINHKNPKTGKYIEHHLKFPPSVPSDKLTHVYTAILKPDNELKILIDGEEKKKVNVMSDDFEPAIIPLETIPDPEDKKPEDWDERAKIPDPNAVKPDDWNEDEPLEIEDEEAEKPEGWLDDEPEEIDDATASKPDDWDDEEDGEWEAQKIDNPKCLEGPGCGVWKRPMKKNPAYRGKWHAPLVDNPHYKGIWAPRQIPNPEYFKVDKPDFDPITAVGIEIWTMQDGILFDNILKTDTEKYAESLRETTWKPKYTTEKQKEESDDASSSVSDGLSGLKKKFFDVLYKIVDIPFLESYKFRILDLIAKAEKQPNLTIGIIVSILVIIITVPLKLFLGGRKPESVSNVRDTAETAAEIPPASNEEGKENEKKEEIEKEEDEDAGSGAVSPRRRSVRRET